MAEVKQTLHIVCEGSDPTVRFAAEELRRCLAIATGWEVGTDCTCDDINDIHVGLSCDIGITPPKVADPDLDDAVLIYVKNGGGYISGANPRSVLLAVYRYLTELGCRWVRPGTDGEYIPHLDHLKDVEINEMPSYRHRGVCIEGSVSVEHVMDMIDWMPKIGFNGYFIQFREAHEFFDRWYAHANNPYLDGEHISVEQAREYTGRVIAEIKKRDMLYHAVGHGWTSEPFGLGGLGWSRSESEPPAEIAQYLAEVNGERKLWGGVPINTNLCYGNPKVRDIVTDEIVDYSAKHPEIDIMHFWLADGANNHCECELCRDTRPSDLYVQMLNELDEKLTAKGIKTRIVFLIYVDLLWPPEREKILHPDRFILMFAPITRTYSQPFTTDAAIPDPPPFERNKLTFPSNVGENIGFLRAWQKSFTGDSFDFDYHMMWDQVKDPGYNAVSKILSQDIRGLRDIGLDGYVSCQVQRAFFPTGLPMIVMGRNLWDRSLSYDEVAEDYFASAFGPDGKLAQDYLESISYLFDPTYLRGEIPKVSPEKAKSLSKIGGVIDAFLPTIERNISSENACWAKSWFYLKHSALICKMLAAACEAAARDYKQTAGEKWEITKCYVQEHEMILHPVLDVPWFISVLEGFLG